MLARRNLAGQTALTACGFCSKSSFKASPKAKKNISMLQYVKDDQSVLEYQEFSQLALLLKDCPLPKVDAPQASVAVGKVCSKCEAKLESDSKFCKRCGGESKDKASGPKVESSSGGGDAADYTDLNGLRRRLKEIDSAFCSLRRLSTTETQGRMLSKTRSAPLSEEIDMDGTEVRGGEVLTEIEERLNGAAGDLGSLERKYDALHARLAHVPKRKDSVASALGAVAELARRLSEGQSPRPAKVANPPCSQVGNPPACSSNRGQRLGRRSSVSQDFAQK